MAAPGEVLMGQITKTRQKLEWKIREIDWSYTRLQSLKNLEYEAHAKTENIIYSNLLKLTWKKSHQVNLFLARLSHFEPPCGGGGVDALWFPEFFSQTVFVLPTASSPTSTTPATTDIKDRNGDDDFLTEFQEGKCRRLRSSSVAVLIVGVIHIWR